MLDVRYTHQLIELLPQSHQVEIVITPIFQISKLRPTEADNLT